MKWTTSASPRPASATCRVTGSRASSVRVVVRRSAGVGSTSRYAPTISRRLSPSSRATNWRSRSDGSSAACRSSSTSTTGRAAAALFRKAVMESKSRKRAPSDWSGGRRRGIGEEVAELGKELRHVSGSLAKLGSESVRVAIAKVRSQRLHPGPVGGGAAGLPASADENSRSARSGVCDQLLGEAALPIPGSPTSRKSRPRPATASSRPPTSSASSRSRPTNALRGLSTVRSAAARLLRRCQLESRVLREYRPLELA